MAKRYQLPLEDRAAQSYLDELLRDIKALQASAAVAGQAAGVSSVNGASGAVNVVSGSGISVGTSGQTITITNTATASGVTTLNGLSGAITLAAGANVTLTPSGNTITIASTASGSVPPGIAIPITVSGQAGLNLGRDYNVTWICGNPLLNYAALKLDRLGTAYVAELSGALKIIGTSLIVNQADETVFYYNGANQVAIGNTSTVNSALLGFSEIEIGATGTVNVSLCGSAPNYGNGEKVIFIGNCITSPNANPIGGVFFYASGNGLYARMPSGAVRTVAAP